jgi:hypothetical protein
MLASIHPLGERARYNRWSVTAGAYLLGSVASGAAAGALAALFGRLALGAAHPTARQVWTAVGALCLLAGALDLAGRAPSGWRRQVNEDWLGAYRGWVYGGGFGLQLGTGFATILVSASVPLVFVLAALSGAWAAAPVSAVHAWGSGVASAAGSGLVIGAVFGSARAVPVLALFGVDRPTRLRAFHRAMERGRVAASRLTGAGTAALGVAVFAAGVWGR